MSAIHLIKKKSPSLPPINEIGDGVCSSGNWYLTLRTARELKGGMIYFHETQAGPSIDGGMITEVEPSKFPGRVVFYFQRDKQCEGVVTPKKGWAQVMKLVP